MARMTERETRGERFAWAWPAQLQTHHKKVLSFLVFMGMVTFVLEMPRNQLLTLAPLLTRFSGVTTAQRLRK